LKKGVELSAIPANAPLPVRGDRIHLQQVILNLAMNGIDAMHDSVHGSGEMSIQTALIDDSAIEVSVADSGMGIPTGRLNRIFGTFYTTKPAGHRTWRDDRAHDRRDLRGEDMGGKPSRRRRKVSLYPAIV
jgi:signal transduction histidine kinase